LRNQRLKDNDENNRSFSIKKGKIHWTMEEDLKLLKLVNERHSGDSCPARYNWKEICKKLNTDKNAIQCAQRWKRVLNPKLMKGSWSLEEEEKLVHMVDNLSMTWAQVSKSLGERSDSQCRYWYNKIQGSQATPWTEKEDHALFELAVVMNYDWDLVYKEMVQRRVNKVTRSPIEFKRRYSELLNKEHFSI